MTEILQDNSTRWAVFTDYLGKAKQRVRARVDSPELERMVERLNEVSRYIVGATIDFQCGEQHRMLYPRRDAVLTTMSVTGNDWADRLSSGIYARGIFRGFSILARSDLLIPTAITAERQEACLVYESTLPPTPYDPPTLPPDRWVPIARIGGNINVIEHG